VAVVKGVTTEDKFSIPVHRVHRFSLSAGVVFSTLDAHRFERANRIDTGGKVYSTFADQENNSSIAFAPAILGHVDIMPLGPADLLLSTGMTARSVNAHIAPDYLLGLSAGLADKVALTLSMNFGRVEQLLIGDPATVAKSPVPTEITRDDAVGESWHRGFAVVVSYRLR
jgi:hypothetical protein